MSKTVKLDDQVHHDLEELRSKRETYSQAVARLIYVHRELTRIVWSQPERHPRPPGQC